MPSTAKTPQEYIDELPPARKEAINNIREVILENLPEGFKKRSNCLWYAGLRGAAFDIS